jgi:F-type H+-transporting ATPase subunit epsilon
MSTYNLLIATPDAVLYDAEVKSAVFSGVDGFFEVLANHAPLIAMIKHGRVDIVDAGGGKSSVDVGEGVFEFHKNKGILLTKAS